MLLSIISIVINIVYIVILNISMYTDRAKMPSGEYREWHRSPISRLDLQGQTFLLYLQIAFAAVSIVTSILMLIGVSGKTLKIIQIISITASTILFAIIMIVTSNSHAKYA